MDTPLHTEVMRLAKNFSIEITTAEAQRITSYSDVLPRNTCVYITRLENDNLEDTLKVIKKICQDGMRPVPHIVARRIHDERDLDTTLRHLTQTAGAADVLVVAGDAKLPAGSFDDSMQLIETGLFDKYDIQTIGFAAHPEGNPYVSDEHLDLALIRKNSLATQASARFYLMTQLVFEAAPLLAWEARVRKQGIDLNIHASLHGIVTMKRLLKYAGMLGIRSSAKFMGRHAREAASLLHAKPPGELILKLAAFNIATSRRAFSNLHLFPFGSFEQTATWMNAIANGDFSIEEDLSGMRL